MLGSGGRGQRLGRRSGGESFDLDVSVCVENLFKFLGSDMSGTVLNEESTPMPSIIHKLTSHLVNNRRPTGPEIDPVSLEVLLLPSGWSECPSQGYPAFRVIYLTVYRNRKRDLGSHDIVVGFTTHNCQHKI